MPEASRTYVQSDSGSDAFREARVRHWEVIAAQKGERSGSARTYHRRLQQIYGWLIPPHRRVLEIGCGRGDLLASLHPARGVGVDFSPTMLAQARVRHPELRFVDADIHDLDLDEKFDVVVLSDLIGDVWDVEQVIAKARTALIPGGRIVLNFYNRLWQAPLRAASAMGLATEVLEQSWLTVHDVENLLTLADCEMVRHWSEVLCPVPIPVFEPFCNRVLVKSWPFSMGALSNFVIARSHPHRAESRRERSVSIVIPARNEAGHIEAIFERMPPLGSGSELIFVEGHSTDNTYDVIEKSIARHPEHRCLLFRQEGSGKGNAVRLGFAHATGEVLMILDADLTVAPEQLPRFYEALVSGKGDFVNGVRLVYPMEERAMRLFNLVANKFFGWLFSWLLGQRVKDTLCGTKVLWRRDYQDIVSMRSYFGDFDPFGDFELLFGAAKLGSAIIEIPVRYRQRVYGDTNIRRWRDGWLLLRMAAVGARRLKWI